MRDKLYYVNHSPWAHRSRIFDAVNVNFGGELRNEFCHENFGCAKEPMTVVEFIRQLRNSMFVESPPGMGEDCYRHYEVMLSGAIPVVKKSLSYGVLENLPHLAVSNWSDVAPALLTDAISLVKPVDPASMERLRKSYWLDHVRNLTIQH